MNVVKKIGDFIGKYMAIIVIGVAAIALFWPSSFTWATPHTTLLLGIVMFGMGMTLDLNDFKIVFSRPKDVLVGCLAQFTIGSWCCISWDMSRRNIIKCNDVFS